MGKCPFLCIFHAIVFLLHPAGLSVTENPKVAISKAAAWLWSSSIHFPYPFSWSRSWSQISQTVTKEDFCAQLGFVTNDQRPREATLQHSKVIKKNDPAGAWKHGSVVLSTGCSSRGPGLDCTMAAHKCERIQFQVIPHPLLTSAVTMHGRVAQTCVQATHTIKYIRIK